MINQNFLNEIESSGIICSLDTKMKDHTTFRIGGVCDYYITVLTVCELKKVVALCKEYGVDYMLVGNGSNLLVSDEGLRKAVIRLGGEFKDISHKENKITCGAGVTLSKLCTYAQAEGLAGLEFAFGIPGTVGGAVFMNAGAYGGEMKDVLESVTHLTPEGEVVTVKACDLELAYRHSIYKENNCLILSAEFSLAADSKDEIKARMDDFMDRRVTKQPLDYPSAGSTFKRPEGAFAGKLIQDCGLKGKSVGGAQVSEKHSGFVINTGDATCRDVLDLIALIQKTVKEETGFDLECEVIHI